MNFYLTGLTSGNLSLTGDDGTPNISIEGTETETVDAAKVTGNVVFCDSCASFIASSKLRVRVGSATGRILTAAEMTAVRNGTLFDLDSDGIVDQSESSARVVITGIDLKDAVTEYTVTLPGTGASRFVPLRYLYLCTAADTLSADGTVNIGTTTAGSQWLAAGVLTALNTVNEVFRADVAVTAIASVADNATLYVKMAAADSGTSGTMTLVIEGVIL